MDLSKVIEKINEDRERVEASFVFCLWKDPTLYDDYKEVNAGNDKTLITRDAVYYFNLGRALRNQGLNTLDALSVDNFLATRPQIKKMFDEYGGWKEIEELKNLVKEENVASYFDEIVKKNMLIRTSEKYEEMLNDIDKFKGLTSESVYETFDTINSAMALTCNKESHIEDFTITDQDMADFKNGVDNGVSYAKACPLLNYTTIGLPIGDMTLLSGHSGTGKSSFAFNILISIAKNGSPVGIISNEMQLKVYKNMLLAYVLTEDLDYYKITRKKIKMGNWTPEEEEMITKAREIINTKYAKMMYFVKMFNNNTNLVIKHMKRLSRLKGVKVFCWDTLKSDDVMTDKMWQELLMSSRRVFNEVAKEKWSLICTFQLALYTTNQRYLDAGCLSNSKQIKEVVSEHIMLRKLWNDEYTGEKFDCKPYKFDGKVKVEIKLDKDKTYVVAFIDKTRNDENARCILYEWGTVWNKWKELGYCTIINDHKGV